MDPITAVQTAEAVQGLLGGVVKLAKKILQARREVKHLPKDIDELLEEIAALEPVTDSTAAPREAARRTRAGFQPVGIFQGESGAGQVVYVRQGRQSDGQPRRREAAQGDSFHP
jgi:hypothetical protein